MTTYQKLASIMKQAAKIDLSDSTPRARAHYRLLKGRYQKLIARLSDPLYDSAMREFERRIKR